MLFRSTRSPASISPAGCSYSVKVQQKSLSAALALMHRFKLPYMGIYVGTQDHGYREVEL